MNIKQSQETVDLYSMLNEVTTVLKTHISKYVEQQRYENTKTFDILNNLPLVIDLKNEIVFLKEEIAELKLKLNNRVSLEISEMAFLKDEPYTLNMSKSEQIKKIVIDSLKISESSSEDINDSDEEDDDDDEDEDDDEDDDDDEDEDDDEDDDAEGFNNELSSITAAIERGKSVTVIKKNAVDDDKTEIKSDAETQKVDTKKDEGANDAADDESEDDDAADDESEDDDAADDESEDDDAAEAEEEELEVEEITIDGSKFYTDDAQLNGTLYEYLKNGEIGKEIGYFKHGEVVFF